MALGAHRGGCQALKVPATPLRRDNAIDGACVAELVTIEGQRYKKREPLGVLGLSVITLGIYWLYWYYTINDEIRRFEKDDTVRPGIALLAVTLG